MCIKAASKCEDMQLVELGYFLQKLLAVWTQSCVKHGISPAQLEVQNTLGKKKYKGFVFYIVRLGREIKGLHVVSKI